MSSTPKRSIRTTEHGRRVVGYVRVSTDEQADSGAGLAAQRSAIAVACAARGLRLVATYEDAGVSGKAIENRPGLLAALEAIEGGRASGLAVAKLDRLSRSLLDFAGLMARSRRRGWALIALDLGVDTTTPSGELMATILASFAQYERRLIGLRTKEALAEKKAAGVRLGRPRSLAPLTAARIVRMRAGGRTLEAIAAELNQLGVPAGHGGRWHATTVRRIALRSEISAKSSATKAALPLRLSAGIGRIGAITLTPTFISADPAVRDATVAVPNHIRRGDLMPTPAE